MGQERQLIEDLPSWQKIFWTFKVVFLCFLSVFSISTMNSENHVLKMYFRSVIVFKEMSKVSFILKKFNCKKKAVCGLEMCLPFLNISLTSQKCTTELLE